MTFESTLKLRNYIIHDEAHLKFASFAITITCLVMIYASSGTKRKPSLIQLPFLNDNYLCLISIY